MTQVKVDRIVSDWGNGLFFSPNHFKFSCCTTQRLSSLLQYILYTCTTYFLYKVCLKFVVHGTSLLQPMKDCLLSLEK